MEYRVGSLYIRNYDTSTRSVGTELKSLVEPVRVKGPRHRSVGDPRRESSSGVLASPWWGCLGLSLVLAAEASPR